MRLELGKAYKLAPNFLRLADFELAVKTFQQDEESEFKEYLKILFGENQYFYLSISPRSIIKKRKNLVLIKGTTLLGFPREEYDFEISLKKIIERSTILFKKKEGSEYKNTENTVFEPSGIYALPDSFDLEKIAAAYAKAILNNSIYQVNLRLDSHDICLDLSCIDLRDDSPSTGFMFHGETLYVNTIPVEINDFIFIFLRNPETGEIDRIQIKSE